MVELFKRSCYFLLDLVTLKRGIKVFINNYPFVFPTRYFRYFPKDYEQENFAFFAQYSKPGMTCMDIGAHFGLFTIYMQKLSGGIVYSFEPTPSTFAIQQKMLALNGVANKVKPVAAAVADQTGKAAFFVEQTPGSVANSLVQYGSRPSYTTSYEVDVVSVDDFIQANNLTVDFIKIDAEGAELSVLKGGKHTLANQRPILILAMHPLAIQGRGENNKMIWDFIIEKKYRVSYQGQLMKEEEFCSRQELFDVHLVPH